MKYNKSYEEQFGRVKRLAKEIKRFAEATDENYEDAIDAFTSFFIQCYHVRDYLIQSGFQQGYVDRFIRDSDWLALCKDLANKQKHQAITRSKPKTHFIDTGIGVSTPIARYYDHFIYKCPRFGIRSWNSLLPLDVIEVADKCIDEWARFISFRSMRW